MIEFDKSHVCVSDAKEAADPDVGEGTPETAPDRPADEFIKADDD